MQIPERRREFTHPARGWRRTGRQEWRWRSTTDATRDAMRRGRPRSSTMARARRTVPAPGGAQAGEPDGSDEAGGGHVRPMPRPAPRRTGPMRNTASWTSTEPPLADARWRNRRHKGSPRISRATRMRAGSRLYASFAASTQDDARTIAPRRWIDAVHRLTRAQEHRAVRARPSQDRWARCALDERRPEESRVTWKASSSLHRRWLRDDEPCALGDDARSRRQ